METPNLHFESLANRYRRRWERNLKAQIKRAQDKTYAAALYFTMLKSLEVIHLNNPFLLALKNAYNSAQKLGWDWDEFMQSARTIREMHYRTWKDQENVATVMNKELMDSLKAEWEKNPVQWNEEPSLEQPKKSNFNPYGFFPEYLSEAGDKPLIKFLVKITTLEKIIMQLTKDYGLTDENILSILEPQTNPITGLPIENLPVKGIEAVANENQPPPQALNGAKEIMSAQEAADFLNIAMPTLYEKTSKGLIPHSKPGGKLLFRRSELDEWIRQGRIHTKEDAEQLAYTLLRRQNEKRNKRNAS